MLLKKGKLGAEKNRKVPKEVRFSSGLMFGNRLYAFRIERRERAGYKTNCTVAFFH